MYLKEKKIISFFVSIVGTTLIDKPDNPIRYMTPLIVNEYPDDTQDFKQELSQDILSVLVWGVCAAKDDFALAFKINNAINLVINTISFIDIVIGCRFKYPNSVSIQDAECDVISNIALDNYLRNNISSHGNTSSILYAMGELIKDRSLMLKIIMDLATSMTGNNVDILHG